MTIAHDIFAETNPAFCACLLATFAAAYNAAADSGAELPVSYLCLPLSLSGDLATTFAGTNKNTGLREWLLRSPKVQVGLAERINGSMEIVTEAIRFGCFADVLSLDQQARLHVGNHKVTTRTLAALGPDSRSTFRIAERLGYWCAAAGSTRSIFTTMGLTL